MSGDCNRIRDLIERGAYLDPTAEGFRDVARHAAGCAECAQLVKELRRAEEIVRTGLRWADPGDGFSARVMRDLSAPRRAVRWRAPLAAAAAIALTTFIAILVATQSRRTAEPPYAPPPAPQVVRAVRISGEFAVPDGPKVERAFPVNADILATGPNASFETVHGVGFALQPNTLFRVAPGPLAGHTRFELKRGSAAVSVKTEGRDQQVHLVVDGFSVLTRNADFLIERRNADAPPALYVDRGTVVISFDDGVSEVRMGEHVALTSGQLLDRVRADEARVRTELASLERHCVELKSEIFRGEELERTYWSRHRQRDSELEMNQEAIALAPDEATAEALEKSIQKVVSTVQTLEFLMDEHMAKMGALRKALRERRAELKQKQVLARSYRSQRERSRALLAGLR